MGDIRHRRLIALLAVAMTVLPFVARSVAAESPSPGATTATEDSYTTDEDTVLQVDAPGVLANDNPGPQTCVASFDPTGVAGDIEVHADGSLLYTPTPNFNGVTTLTYGIATHPDPGCDVPPESSATITITVTPVNDPPTAVADSFTALKDHTLTIAAPGVLANDSDVDGDPLTAVQKGSPAHGAVTLAANGGFSYTPNAGYVGPDAFSYEASDGIANSPQRLVSLSVVAVPPTPTPVPVVTPTPLPPTASPEPSPTESPLPSDSGLPSPSPLDTGPAIPPSPSASPTAIPSSVGGGPPLLAIAALFLLAGLLGMAAWFFVRSQRSGDGDELEPEFAADGDFDPDDTGGDAA